MISNSIKFSKIIQVLIQILLIVSISIYSIACGINLGGKSSSKSDFSGNESSENNDVVNDVETEDDDSFLVSNFSMLACVGSSGNNQNGEDCSAYSEWTLSAKYKVTSPIDAGKTCDPDYMTAGFTLVENDCVAGTTWQPIGTSAEPFTGIFNGGEETISNLHINQTANNIGLFGVVSGGTTEIKNIRLEVIVASGVENVGALVGSILDGSSVMNCRSSGGVEGDNNVGGLVGYTMNSSITNSSAMNNVTVNDLLSQNSLGGLVGEMNGGSIERSYTTGNVNSSVILPASTNIRNQQAGGLVGRMNNGSIANCYTTGNISGHIEYIGGLVGYINNGSIENCYTTGNIQNLLDIVNSSSKVGGLVGNMQDNARLSNSYSAGDLMGLDPLAFTTEIGGLVGGVSTNSAVTGVNYFVDELDYTFPLSGILSGDCEIGATCEQVQGVDYNARWTWLQESFDEGNALGWDSSLWGDFTTTGQYPCLKGVTPSCN